MVSFVISKIDYDNALLYGLLLNQLCKLPKVQKYTAEVIFKKYENEIARPPLISSHLLH